MNSNELDSFLLKNSGVTGEAIKTMKRKIYNKFENPLQSSVFFKPYKSAEDPLQRTLSILTAPVCLAILTVKLLAESVYLAFKSLADLAVSDCQTAKATFKGSMRCLLTMLIVFVGAFISPLVNAIDLLGSSVTSLERQCSDGHGYR